MSMWIKELNIKNYEVEGNSHTHVYNSLHLFFISAFFCIRFYSGHSLQAVCIATGVPWG